VGPILKFFRLKKYLYGSSRGYSFFGSKTFAYPPIINLKAKEGTINGAIEKTSHAAGKSGGAHVCTT
jgi:hypothetical protein